MEEIGEKQDEGPALPDEKQLRQALDVLRSEQNLVIGAVGGTAAALVGAALWAAITCLTDYQIGWMAVGVGALVGVAVRALGRGVDKVFGVFGAVLALAGCLLGNILAVCGMVATQEDMGLLDVLGQVDLQVALEMLRATFSPMDLVFYGLAVFEGYRFSFRQVTQEELAHRCSARLGHGAVK